MKKQEPEMNGRNNSKKQIKHVIQTQAINQHRI